MELGRRLGGNHTLWTVLGVLAGLVFLVFGAGTTYSLLTPGYVFEQGELAAESGILAGSLALTGFSGYRSRALGRGQRVATERWLPDRDECHEPWEDVQVLRLRAVAWRAWGLVVLWVAVFIGCVGGLSAIEARSDALLDTGTRTPGMVDAAHESTGWGESKIWVQYETHSGPWRAEIVRSSDRTYEIGEAVTVVYDPRDPTDVRTTEERNNSELATEVVGWTLLALLFLLPASVYAAIRWGHRYRAVRRTAWRAATVTVVSDGQPTQDLYVRYRDGSKIWLRATTSTHRTTRFKGETNRPGWVGGTGRDMVVLFPRAGKEPLAVPVHPENERHPSE